MKKNILITGGSGFIGSNIKDVLFKLGHVVLTVGRNKNEDFVCDLKDPKLEKVFSNFVPDVVCHFASGSNIQRAEENKEKEFNDTVISTKNLIKQLLLLKSKPQIIYLSSQAVYGTPKFLPINETHPLDPVTVYGEYKLKVEEIITQSKLNYLIFRVSSVYGGSQNYNKSGAIAKFIHKMKNNESPIIFNSDEVFFDFIYIKDLTSAIVEAIQNNLIENDVFNLGSGEPLKLRDVLNVLYKYFPNAPKPELKVTSIYLSKEHKGLYLDIRKVQAYLKWTLKYNIEEGLRDMFSHSSLLAK